MQYQFTNNAVSALAAAITSTDTAITLTTGTGDKFAEITSGNGFAQRLTLTNAATPTLVEIVEVSERMNASDMPTVIRGVEGTTARAWPVGTVVSARITAGMLGGFVQSNGAEQLSANSVAIGKGARTTNDGTWVISGHPIIQKDNKRLLSDAYNTYFQGGGVEAVIVSQAVDIGAPIPWAANMSVYDGQVVVPTTPNGYQYRAFFGGAVVAGTTGATEPAFSTTPGAVIQGDGEVSWLTQNVAGITFGPSGGVMFPTEVGFICKTVSGGAPISNPVVSIESGNGLSSYAASESLAVSSGEQIFRFSSLAWKNGASQVSGKVVTPATGASIIGCFYVRGLIVEM